MSEREALYRAVCASPDDDTPRLVFADWLDEHGEGDRATFIRVQCELERLPPTSREAVRLMAAHHDLLKRTDWEDLDRLPAGCWPAESPDRLAVLPDLYRRGFLWRAQVNGAETFQSVADDLFRAVPVGAVTLFDATPGDVLQLARSPHLGRLRSLTVRWSRLARHGRGDPGTALAVLARSPFAENLTALDIGPGDWPASALSYTPLAARLRRLRIGSGATNLGQLEGLDHLERLDLDAADLHLPENRAVAEQLFRQLRELSLSRVTGPIELDVMIHRVASLPHLGWLDWSGNPMPELARNDLTQSDLFPELRALAICGCRPGRYELAKLLAAAFARRLTLLDLRGNRVTADEAELLCRADLPESEWIGVSPEWIGPEPRRTLQERFGPRLVIG